MFYILVVNRTLQLYRLGRSRARIAEELGISKQRVSQILTKNGIVAKHLVKKSNPNETELIASRKLREMGFKTKHMPYNYKFDICVNNKLRVEVKSRSIPRIKFGVREYKKYKFDIRRKEFDVIICIVLEKKTKKVKSWYIFSREQVKNKTVIEIVANPKNNSKYQKNNRDAWSIITKKLASLENKPRTKG